MIPALKSHDYDWPDTPREGDYTEYEKRKRILQNSGLETDEYENQVHELARELGI